MYKSDMGLCLQRMVEAYNLLILMQFSGFYSIENEKEKEFTEKSKYLDEKIAIAEGQQEIQKIQQAKINVLMASKDQQIA